MILRLFALLVAATAAFLLCSRLGSADIHGGEEGRMAVMARNAIVHPLQFLNPSPEPAGAPAQTPFLGPLLFSFFLRLPLSPELSLRLLPVLSMLVAGLAFYLIFAPHGPLAQAAAMAVLWINPLSLSVARLATPEAPALMFAALGFLATLKAVEHDRSGGLALAGALLGASFLLRPWLCLPALLASLVTIEWGSAGSSRKPTLRPLATLLSVFALVAASQLILVSLFSPATGGHWLRAYLATFPGRVLGAASAAAARPGVLESLSPVLPLVALGFLGLLSEPFGLLQAGVLVWWLTSFALRLMGLADADAGLMRLASWALLAGAGAAVLSRWGRQDLWRYPAAAKALWTLLLIDVALTFVPPLAPAFEALGGRVLICVLTAIWGLLVWGVAGRSATPDLKIALCALVLALVLFLQGRRAESRLAVQDRGNRYREVERYLRPELDGAALDATAFVAPEPEALSFYAYRRGIDWADRGRPLPWSGFLTLADGRHARAYVLPSKREDSGIAETSAETTLARARDWLPRARVEVTSQIGRLVGGTLPYRVFVNGAPPLPQLGPERPPGLPPRKSIVHPPPGHRRYRRL